MRKTGLVLFMAGWMAVAAAASEKALPAFQVPDCLGVNIHFVEPRGEELDQIRAAGFGLVRMDFGWAAVEKEKGKYDFEGYKRLTQALGKRGMMPLYILDYSNPLYESSRSVLTAEGRQAFARFAVEALKAIGKDRVLWEIWNEPNIEQFWKEQPSAEAYVQLVEETAKAMRQPDPECTILAPATSQIPMDFLKACFDRGLLKWIDAVSVHPYREQPPETALEEYQALRDLMKNYERGAEMPIVSGEWGYSVHPYKKLNVDEHRQAQFIVRQFLTNFMAGARLSIWYDWHDDGPDPAEREHNFGTVKQDYTPKETYKAAQVFMRELQGMKLTRSSVDNEKQDYRAVFSDGTKRVLVIWTTGDPRSVTLEGVKVKPQAVTMLGENVALSMENGRAVLPVSQDPLYVMLE
ncbi:MAG: cellulase family glycosylhydrolase [bacterium]